MNSQSEDPDNHFLSMYQAVCVFRCERIKWTFLLRVGRQIFLQVKKVKQSHYRPGVAQRVPGS